MSSAPLKRRLGRALASVLLASLCAAGVTAPSAQAAQEEEGIALVDIRPVTMTWKQARRNVGIASTWCNISDRQAMGLKPRLEGFNFTRDEKPVSSKVLQLLDSDLKVLKRSPKLQAGLRAGDCLKIVVRVIPGTPIVDPRSFHGRPDRELRRVGTRAPRAVALGECDGGDCRGEDGPEVAHPSRYLRLAREGRRSSGRSAGARPPREGSGVRDRRDLRRGGRQERRQRGRGRGVPGDRSARE